ncbi:MAG: 6-phosphofructokinase, partial [Alphaproteobacteria bacterium]|nr:6-phosphofructokinase [Alphaproteobacteria bacterium]
IAGYADIALIPEIPYTYEGIVARLKKSRKLGRRHAIVVVAEGVKTPDGKHSISTNGRTFAGISEYFSDRLRKDGFNVRANILGHIQRSGTPVPQDRILASAFGVHAVELIAKGATNRVVVYQKAKVTDMSLEDILKIGNSPVDPRGDMVKVARSMGIYVGEQQAS